MNNLKKYLIGSRRLAQAGFSLMELMIAIAILGLIMGIVGTNVMKKFDESKVDSTKIQMRNLATILQDYRRMCGFYPKTDQSLDALVKPPAECKGADPEGWMKKLPNDAWGRPFMYTSDGNKFTIRSLGRDGAEGGAGFDSDISSDEID